MNELIAEICVFGCICPKKLHIQYISINKVKVTLTLQFYYMQQLSCISFSITQRDMDMRLCPRDKYLWWEKITCK